MAGEVLPRCQIQIPQPRHKRGNAYTTSYPQLAHSTMGRVRAPTRRGHRHRHPLVQVIHQPTRTLPASLNAILHLAVPGHTLRPHSRPHTNMLSRASTAHHIRNRRHRKRVGAILLPRYTQVGILPSGIPVTYWAASVQPRFQLHVHNDRIRVGVGQLHHRARVEAVRAELLHQHHPQYHQRGGNHHQAVGRQETRQTGRTSVLRHGLVEH